MAPAGGGGAPKTWAFDPKAYAKAVMHSCKHSSETVIGIFVGSSKGNVLKVVDAMPLFHTHALAPMLKVSCMLIEQHCKAGGLEIIGIYHATPHGAADMTRVKPIADKIASNFAAASVWAVDPARLAERQFALRGTSRTQDEWKPIAAEAVSLSEEAISATVKALTDLKYLEVVDFDDHLNDVSLSWLNTTLFKGHELEHLPLEGTD